MKFHGGHKHIIVLTDFHGLVCRAALNGMLLAWFAQQEKRTDSQNDEQRCHVMNQGGGWGVFLPFGIGHGQRPWAG